MIDFASKSQYDIFDLISLMKILRGEEGCPWDREQTHKSIRRNLLEEAYEAASAIDEENSDDLLEELGDLLLQVVFHADIAESNGFFNLDDIIDVTCKKLLRRHPHVFGSRDNNLAAAPAKNGEESISVWETVKKAEKSYDTIADSMDSVARAIPALWRAEKIQKKAAKAGFDWPDYTGAFEALRLELKETESAIKSGDDAKITEELGDLLFSVVNTARFFNVDPEEALNASSDKFTRRFRRMEELASLQAGNSADISAISSLTPEEMETLYRKAKCDI